MPKPYDLLKPSNLPDLGFKVFRRTLILSDKVADFQESIDMILQDMFKCNCVAESLAEIAWRLFSTVKITIVDVNVD